MDRRLVIRALAVWATAVAFQSRGQRSPTRRIGFLSPLSRSTASSPDANYDAFMRGMRDLGYIEGKNLVVEWRFADGNYKRLPGLVNELLRTNVEVLVTHGQAGVQAAQRATTSTPIVAAVMADPVGSHFATSLAHPGGNITGLSLALIDLSPKHVELLRSIMPKMTRVAVLVNPRNSADSAILSGIQAAADEFRIKSVPMNASGVDDLEAAFAAMVRQHLQAAIVVGDAFFLGQGRRLADLSLRNRIATITPWQQHTMDGVLMSYGQKHVDFFRRAATYVDMVLKGAKPSDIPIEQPTTIHLAINAKTAKTLGIKIPSSLLLRADEVIQ